MKLIDLLINMYNINPNDKIKLVRHKENEFNIQEMYRDSKDNFELYQQHQRDKVFDNCKFIISFIGEDKKKAKLIGMYEVISQSEIKNIDKLDDELKKVIPQNAKYCYELKKLDKLSDLEDRLIIDWGNGVIQWHQWLKKNCDKKINEIVPKGFYKTFPGFEDFVLSFKELKLIVQNYDSNRDWHDKLSSVYGIYLIVDLEDGKQYIGSAYGKEGILGRWKAYIENGHGGNKSLISLIEKEPSRCEKFQFTILRTLSKTLTKEEIIRYEKLYKNKLGTRIFGLNLN